MAWTRSEVLALVIEVSAKNIEGIDPADLEEDSHYKDDMQADSGEIEEARKELESTLGVRATDEEVKNSLRIGLVTDLYCSKLREKGELVEE